MTREDQLAALCVGWKSSLSNGVPTLTPEAMCADCPELLAEFREQLALDAVDKLFGDTEFTDPPPTYENLKGAGYASVGYHDEGGLGVVLVGEEVQLRRRVAIKQLKPGTLTNPGARERFFAEAEITAHLDHPGVVPIFRSGWDDLGQPYYAMRFIEGEKLGQAIQRLYDDRAANPDASQHIDKFRQLLRCFVSVCQTIGYAHSRGVLHRDLKPDNVMLGAFGAVLVVDWGLAKRIDRPDSEIESAVSPVIDESAVGATRQGWAKGSPAFMSPEQAAGDWANVSPASDIYGLGATLYVLLTGQLPYTGDTSTEIISKVKAGPCAPPEQVNRSVPKALAAICNKAMSRQAGTRYPSALNLAEDIQRWLDDKPVNVFRDSVVVLSWRWMRQHRPLVAALAATVLVGVIGLSAGLYFVNAEKNKTKLALRDKTQADEEKQIALNQKGAALQEVEKQRKTAEQNLSLAEEQRQAAEQNLLRAMGQVTASVRVISHPEVSVYRHHPIFLKLCNTFLDQLDGLSNEGLPKPKQDLLDAERFMLRLQIALISPNKVDSLSLERRISMSRELLESRGSEYPDGTAYQLNLGTVYLLQARRLILESRTAESHIAAQNAYDKFMLHAAEATPLGQESLQGAVAAAGILGFISIDVKDASASPMDPIDKVLDLLKPQVAAEGQMASRDQVFASIGQAHLLWTTGFISLMKNHDPEEAAQLAGQAQAVLNRIPEEWHGHPQFLRVRVAVRFLSGLTHPSVDEEAWKMLTSAGDDMENYLHLIGGLHEEPDRQLQLGVEGLIAECGVRLLPVLDQQPWLWKLLNNDILQKVRLRSQIAIDTSHSLEQLIPAEARDPALAKDLQRQQAELDKFKSK